jgi:sensor histidine kinase YesM
MSSAPPARKVRIDWQQWFYPGPRRVFTPEEMARAGQQPWPVAIDHYLYVNLVLLLAVNSGHIMNMRTPWVWPLVLALGWGALSVARWLWRKPTRVRLNQASYALLVLVPPITIWAARSGHRELVLQFLPVLLAVLTLVLMGWWILTIYRVEQIEARLRELAEQEAALKLSTRLAAAQIQPHFLFNTLASLQHWVDTGDARAAPLLRDFTAYLRATLPMFERELQPLADEMEMVKRYLAIMQARLGARLDFALDVPAGLAGLTAELPPGVVLTLVENAIAHGIEPQLRGGRIDVAARADGGRLVLTVRDDGPGLVPGWAEGVGLSNTRRRLLQACPHATLTLADASPGCIATLTL